MFYEMEMTNKKINLGSTPFAEEDIVSRKGSTPFPEMPIILS